MNEPYTTGGEPERDSGVVDSTKEEAAGLKDTVREEARQTAEKVKEEAKTAVHHVKDAGTRFIDRRRDSLAKRLSQYSRDLRAAAERLNGQEQVNPLAGPAESASQQLESLSGYLRDRSPGEMLQDIESLARRRPEIVFGGLFLAGLMAARFLKASPGHARDDDDSMMQSGNAYGGPRHLPHSPSSPSRIPARQPWQPSPGADWRSQHLSDDAIAGETPAEPVNFESSTRSAL